MYENKELGTYPDEDILVETYTTGVSNKTLYDLLGRSNLQDYSFDYYVDGVVNANATAATILSRTSNDFGVSNDGVLTQVFVDHEANNGKGAIIITSINTYLAQAAADYNKARETISLKIYTSHAEDTDGKTNSTSQTVDVDDVPAIADLKADNFVLVHRSGKNQSNNKLVVVDIAEPEIIAAATVSEYSKGDKNTVNSNSYKALFKSVTANGTKYTAPPWPTMTPAL